MPRQQYVDSVDLLGSPRPAASAPVRVRFERTLTGGARRTATVFVAINVALSACFLAWIASRGPGSAGPVALAAFVLIFMVEALRVMQNLSLWLFAMMAKDPVPLHPPTGLRVALLTTIVPSKEPIDVLARTLEAMGRVRHDGTLDIWVLDEGDDLEVRRVAGSLGVRHFTRRHRPEYNLPAGPFRAKTKAGNYNAWRVEHEQDYDVVVQLDPDHVPDRQFLRRTLGYFRDEDVAFAVSPQVYGNGDDGFVARAASTQMYPFHAIVQRGGNGLGAPMLIGTNHLYRVAAWQQVGGYQDSIIEDHLTGLRVNGERNPHTGMPWKGVYTPDVLAVGDAPSTWTDYFNQQMRWSRGVWEIACRHSPKLFPRLKPKQILSYLALQFYYPTLGVVWLLANLLLALYLATGVTALPSGAGWFLPLWASVNLVQFAMFLWLRRYNVAEHERRHFPYDVILLSSVVAPVYAAAAASFLLRRPLGFVVTAKGDLVGGDSLVTFKYHLIWSALLICLLVFAFIRGFTGLPYMVWALIAIANVAVPLAFVGIRRLQNSSLGGAG